MRRCLTFALFVFFACSLLVSQETTGTIVGTVKESTGALLPNATVTVTNTDRNAIIRTVKTNNEGNYVAALLPVGHYSVSIAAPGFKTSTTNNLQVNVSDRLAVNATLAAGQVSEVVNVEAPALLVDTQSAAATGLIDGTQIRELALSARNYEELVSLMPGVSSAVSDTIFVGVETPGGGTNEVDFSINGNRFSQNNWTIDGADNVDRGGNFTLLNYPSVDAIAEFKVLRGLYNAEYGRGAGGEINVITRSGGNRFHGSAYEFFRNDFLNANNYFNNRDGNPRPPLRYNDFGWTLGGPIYIPGHYNTNKDKTYFFYSEEIRRIVTSSTTQPQVPTAGELQGIFDATNLPDGLCQAYDSAGNCTNTVTAVGNTITLTQPINPVAAAYITDVFSKLPLSVDPASTQHLVVENGKNIFNYRQEIIRVDHTFNPRLMLTGRFINDTIPTINPNGLFDQSSIPGYATTETNSPGRSFLIRGTMSLSHNILNEAGYAWSYGALLSTPTGLNTFANSPNVAAAINLPFASPLQRIPNLDFGIGSGYFGFGPYVDVNRNHQWFDNLSWVKGKHLLKFGFSYNRYQKNENDAGANASNGSFDFFNTDPGGNPQFEQEWASFLLGNVSSFTQTKQDFHAKIRQRTFEAYAQDEYRLRPNLMVTLGLRYTMYGQPFTADSKNTGFSPTLFDPTKAPAIDPTSGQIVPGTGTDLNGLIISKVNSPYGEAVANTPKANFAPRIGISWDPFGKGKTAIRTGFGLFYDSPAVGFVENNTFSNPPFIGNVTISNTVLDNPASVAPDVNLFPQAIKGVLNDWKLPYTEQWSLDVEQEMPWGLIADVGYYGSVGRHLIGIVDLNQPKAGAYVGLPGISTPVTEGTPTAQLNAVRPFQGYGPINISTTSFSSSYNSLQASLRKVTHGGSQFGMNYTWSKALTNAGNDFSTPQNNADLRSELGPTDFDRRHIFNMNFVYVLPWQKSQTGLLGHVLGGWEVSGIGTFETGLFLTPTGVITDPAGLGLLDPFTNASARPDQNGDPNAGAPHTVDQWFNPDVFNPSPSTIGFAGNARRGTIKGPGIERFDLSVFKNFKIREGLGLQFRTEAFNVFNHTNFQDIDTNVTDGPGAFGTVLSAHEPRIIQLGLKLTF